MLVQQRREKEERRLAELRERAAAAEASIASESGKRQEQARALKAWAGKEIAAVATTAKEALALRAA